MKNSHWFGILGVLALIGVCFLPWTYYPDINQSFSGFYSENDHYGKPGKAFTFLGIFAILFFSIPKVWAKRWNLVIVALLLAYAIRTYIVFTSCYSGICPTKLAGIYLMLAACIFIIAMALLPSLKEKPR